MRDGGWYWMGLVAGVTIAMSSALAAVVDMATATGAEHQRRDAVELVVDEIFHVAQAKRYCAGRWDEWDDKITTLPGMYVMSATISLIAAALLRSSNTQDSPLFCSPTALRWTVNVPAAVLAAVSMYAISSHVRAAPGADRAASRRKKDKESRQEHTAGGSPAGSDKTTAIATVVFHQQSALQAAALTQFPLHYFFGGLYYTDTPSTAFVLAGYASAQRRHYLLSAVCLSAAVYIRQTNAVWCLFVFALSVLDIIDPSGDVTTGDAGPIAATVGLLQMAIAHLGRVIRRTAALLLPVVGLACFVVQNGSIVAGDREAHRVQFHGMQLLYFLTFFTVAAAPLTMRPARVVRFFAWLSSQRPANILILLSLMAIGTYVCVEHGTVVHPYLLSDNRHYAFYIWRRILRYKAARYALGPASVYAVWALTDICRNRHGRFWVLGFIVCAAAVTVPSPLFELRYFILPFLIAAAQAPMQATEAGALLACNIALNIMTLVVFVSMPFGWPDGSVARFIW